MCGCKDSYVISRNIACVHYCKCIFSYIIQEDMWEYYLNVVLANVENANCMD